MPTNRFNRIRERMGEAQLALDRVILEARDAYMRLGKEDEQFEEMLQYFNNARSDTYWANDILNKLENSP